MVNICRCLCVFAAMMLSLHASAQGVAYKPFKHYVDKVEQFAKMPAIDSCDIVMLGNSLTEFGGNWGKLLQSSDVVNRGIAGDDADGIIHRLNQILPGRPRAIFLMVGINDISHGLTAAQVASKAEAVISKIRRESPSTRLFVQSLLPINESTGKWKLLSGKSAIVGEVNRLLSDYCKNNGITYIDLYIKFVRRGTTTLRSELTSDGLHLSAQGYKLWAFELRRYVKQLH